MTFPTQIINWLTMAFEQPLGLLTESFYYDKRDNEFFSIHFADYFMLDEDMNILNNVTTNYSKVQENLLVDRIRRGEINDPNIISIPRVSLEDRKSFMSKFLHSLTDKQMIELLNQEIQNQDYRTKFDFYFSDETDELTKKKWEAEKANFLYEQAERFLNLNNINTETASLWDVDLKGAISIDLIEDEDDYVETLPTTLDENEFKKIWWKFWQPKQK